MLKSIILTEKQIENIEDRATTLIAGNNYKNTSKKQLLNTMSHTYIEKSLNKFTYFIKKVAPLYNHLQGSYMSNLWQSGHYQFFQNIHINKTTDKPSIKEKKRGAFLQRIDSRKAHQRLAKVRYLEYINKDKKRLFLTFTVPSHYHWYSTNRKNNSHYKNKKCRYDNYEQSIHRRYKRLREIQRRFYKRLSKKKIAKDYFLMIEPHKSLTPHMHLLLWVNKEDIPFIQHSFNLIVKRYNLKKTDFQQVHTAKRSSYVTKYLLKTINSDKGIDIYREYNSYFKEFKLFGSSNFKHTNQKEIDFVYKYLSKEYPAFMQRLKSSRIPLFYLLEIYIKNGKFKFEYEEVISNAVDYDASKSLVNNLKTQYKTKSDTLSSKSELDRLQQHYILKIKYTLQKYTKQVKLKKLKYVFNNFSVFNDRTYYSNGKLHNELIYHHRQYQLLDVVNLNQRYALPFEYQLKVDERFWLTKKVA